MIDENWKAKIILICISFTYPLHIWSLRTSKGPGIILNKFWNVYDSTLNRKRGQIFGKRSGFHIMTVCIPKYEFLSRQQILVLQYLLVSDTNHIQSYRVIVLRQIDNSWKIVYKMSSGIADVGMSVYSQWIHWRWGQCVCVCCTYFTELMWLFVRVFSLKEFSASKHQSLVLCPSCVPEKVGIN